ncbi:MAG: hypothetical protein ACRC8S_09550 [Fimbriiglobus sp.]
MIRRSFLVAGLLGLAIIGVGLGLGHTVAQSPGSVPTAEPMKPRILTVAETEEMERLDHDILLADLRIETARLQMEELAHVEQMVRLCTASKADLLKARIANAKAREDIVIHERTKTLANRQKQKLLLSPTNKAEVDPALRKLLEARVAVLEKVIEAQKKQREAGATQGLDEMLRLNQIRQVCLNSKLALNPSKE